MEDSAKNVFLNRLLAEIIAHRQNNLTDNYDESIKYNSHFREEINRSLRDKILNARIPMSSYYPIDRKLSQAINIKSFYRNFIQQFEQIAWFYHDLNDEQSKEWLIKILAYRILGYKKVKLPRNNPLYWQGLKEAAGLSLEHGDIIANNKFTLNFLDLSPLGFNIKVNMSPIGAALIFIQRQYEYHGKNFICKAEQGDVVIDGGACWGDTALYFSHEVGETGKVFAFEFIPENLAIIQRNLDHNPHLVNRICIMEHPLWDISDQELYYYDHGPGSTIGKTLADQSDKQICKTLSIDDLVERNQLNQVDFIKMDIEGSELNALKGAEKTIRQFKPKLAISIYHKPDDFHTIPKFINDLKLGYDFYMDHHTIHFWETVLFAVPRNCGS